jgi:hypothetical protein
LRSRAQAWGVAGEDGAERFACRKRRLTSTTGRAFGGVAAGAASAMASNSVSINHWCQTRPRYPGGTAWHGVVVAWNVYGWRCECGTADAAEFGST